MQTNLTIDARLITNSGIGVYLQNLLKSPLLGNYNLKLLYRHKDKEKFTNLPFTAKLVRYDAGLYSLQELLQTPAKTKGSDVFWSPHYNIPLFSFASKLKVVTIHDVYHLAYFDTLHAKEKVYARLMMKWAVRYSDIIFTVSNFSKKEIIKYTGCKAEKIHVIYNEINFEKYNNKIDADIAANVLKKYKISGSYFLSVGNVKPHKNLRKALEGYKVFLQKHRSNYSDIKFVIVGKREGFITGDKELQTLISDPFFESKVLFTGWMSDEDLPVLYQNASLFIFPSLYEGFGFPPLEAMAAGCPVISSNAACMPEIYEDAAKYFDPSGSNSIANALFDMISNTAVRNEFIAKGLLHSKKFNEKAGIRKSLDIIEQHL